MRLLFTSSSLALLLLATGCYQQQGPAYSAPALPGPATLARLQQAFVAAHPLPANLADFRADVARPFYSLYTARNIGCACGPSEMVLYQRDNVRSIELEPNDGIPNWYTFNAYTRGRLIGRAYIDDVEEAPAGGTCELDFAGYHIPALQLDTLQADTVKELILVPLNAPGFRQRVQEALTPPARLPGFAYPASFYQQPALLTAKGVFLQQLGHPAEALLFFDAVLAHHATYAAAYLHRADTHWLLRQYPAALADYRRYLALNHSQQLDSAIVPAYVKAIARKFSSQ